MNEDLSGRAAFGSWLKQRRKALGLTQKELAERVECSTVTIEKIESGARKPSSQVAELLAVSFNIPDDERKAFVEFARSKLSDSRLKELTRLDSHAPWRTLHTLASNLPAPRTAFIGRHKEIRTVSDLLRDPSVRLLTMSGPPGIGKTRLSLRVAEELVLEFDDGVTFIPLALIRDPDLVASSIAQALGIHDAGGQPLMDSLKNYLKDKRALLVLDNFEQVMSAAPLVAELLSEARWLKVLVTSREILHTYGEYEFPVPPMSLLDSPHLPPIERLIEYETIRLFAERAKAVRPDFALTAENARAVVEICSRLDRMPLAIELAAVHTRNLTPIQIVSRLDNSLELLTGGARDLPARQRALRSAIDWSYDLLGYSEQLLFRRLAVFGGGCSIESAAAVCDIDGDLGITVVEGIEALFDKSLLVKEEIRGELRFSMLETIREYAWWRLVGHGEEQVMQGRHAAYFLWLIEEAKAHMKGSGQLEWLDRSEQEHDNLRAVLRWSLDCSDFEMALRFSSALWRFWLTHGYLTEGRRWLTAALEPGSGVSGAVRANALNGAGNLACACGDFVSAQPLYEESLAIRRSLGDMSGVAHSLNNLAVFAHTQCNFLMSKVLHRESLAIKRELGDKWGIASSLGNLGIVASDQGDYVEAATLHKESLLIRRELNDRLGVALSLLNLGVARFIGGDPSSAQALFEESLAIRKELGDKLGIAECLVKESEVAHYQGSYAKAAYLAQQSLDICREVGDKPGIANSLLALGHAAHRQGQPRHAATLLNESLTIRRDLLDKRGATESLSAIASVAVALGQREKAATLFRMVDHLLITLGFHLQPVDRTEYEQSKAALGEMPGATALEVEEQGESLEAAMAYALE